MITLYCIAWFSWQPGEESISTWRPVDGEPGERFPLPGVTLNVENPVNEDTDQLEKENTKEIVE